MIRQTASIDVRAPAAQIYDLIARDIVTPASHPESSVSRKPVGPGPLREGFTYIGTRVHERRTCVSEWEARVVRPGEVVEARSWHFCSVHEREVRGGERWEFAEAGGTTRVTLSSWTETGWFAYLIVGRSELGDFDLRKRLANVQYRAERS